MQAHADPQGSRLAPRLLHESVLGCHAGTDRGWNGGKDGHQPVAGGLDHLSIAAFHRGTQDRVVTRKGGSHRLRKPLPELCAALKIGEEERQGSRRRLRMHGARSSPSDSAPSGHPQSLSPRLTVRWLKSKQRSTGPPSTAPPDPSRISHACWTVRVLPGRQTAGSLGRPRWINQSCSWSTTKAPCSRRSPGDLVRHLGVVTMSVVDGVSA